MYLTSCSDNDGPQKADATPLTLSVGLAGQPARAIIEETTLPEGSEIGLFLTDDGGSSYDGTTYANVKYTATGTGDTQAWDADSDIMLSATSGTLHAYYPYNSSVTNIQDVPVEAASLTDYMYATSVSGLSVNSNEAQITMNHALTAIKLTLTRGTYSGTGKVTNLSVTSDALATAASLDATTGELSSITGAGTALAHDTDMTLEESAQSTVVTAVPTTATATVNITATVDGLPFAVTTSATAFRQGNVYEYSLTVNNESMTVADVNVTPWNAVDNGQLDYEAYDPFKNAIVATYYVDETATASPVQILSSNGNFDLNTVSKIEVDGVESTPSKTYTFSTPGEHTVKFLCTDETVVPDCMFSSCTALTDFKLPTTVAEIGDNAFMGCTGLTGTLTIPEGVTEIGYASFYECKGLTGLELGNRLTVIGAQTFWGCTGLTGALTIPNSVTSIGSKAFYNCKGFTGILTIPERITYIVNNAFYGCRGLNEVIIPKSVTTIQEGAFYGCIGLTKVVFPEFITKIEKNAFYNCSALISIVSKAMTAPTISNYTFQYFKSGGTLTVPTGATGYDAWMATDSYYLGYYNWTLQYSDDLVTE